MSLSNLVFKDGSTTAAHERLVSFYDGMGDEIREIVENERKSQAELKEVQRELGISKRAFVSIETEFVALKKEKEELEKLRDDLLNQLKPCRIVVLIDGDGAIFNVDLIAEGETGGHKAASMLSNSIKQLFPGRPHLEISVYAFFNQNGLAGKFGKISQHEAKNKLGEFMVGFNQASERFIIADVGYAKEGADAKIKGFLDAELRLPQTEMILFGGCHDNGYVTALRSHITSGCKQKLMLLQSYDEIAAGIRDLGLPVLQIPGLFMAGNLDNLRSPVAATTDVPLSAATPVSVPPTPRQRGISVAQSERSDSAAGQNVDSETPVVQGLRPVDRSIPLSALRPAPCILHYLSPTGCKFNPCTFDHFYDFTPADVGVLRKLAKGMPCANIAKGINCSWGDSCIYGHKCRYLNKCKYAKNGKCKFKGPTMHTPDTAPSEA